MNKNFFYKEALCFCHHRFAVDPAQTNPRKNQTLFSFKQKITPIIYKNIITHFTHKKFIPLYPSLRGTKCRGNLHKLGKDCHAAMLLAMTSTGVLLIKAVKIGVSFASASLLRKLSYKWPLRRLFYTWIHSKARMTKAFE